jgi:hypothetical protein
VLRSSGSGDNTCLREGEQLLDHACAAVGGVERLLNARPDVVGNARKRGVEHGDNGGEGVVEIVSDAAGQSPDGFHLLRLAQLLFGLLDVGEVADEG